MTEPRFRIITEAGPKKHFEILKTLQNIEPIEEGSIVPANVDDLDRVVEEPLLEACKIFFIKGVKTWMSSANKNDIKNGEAHIIIKYESLSEENKRVADRYAVPYPYRDISYVKFTMYVTESTTIKSISKHMVKIASDFKSQ